MTVLALMGLMLGILLFIGLPIAAVLGTTGLFWIVVQDPSLLRGAARSVMNIATGDVLVSLPLFILMGLVVQKSNVATKFYRSVALWLRGVPGGLLHANILVCSVFGSVSGSSVATAATVGSTAIPDLLKFRYDRQMLTGSLAAGGTLGILIPPSIPMIVYGATVQESIGKLFVGAIIPALILIALFMSYIFIRTYRNPELAPPIQTTRPSRAEFGKSLVNTIPLVAIAAVVIGGLYFGWTTSTEAAALGLAMALLFAAATRNINVPMLRNALIETVYLTPMLMFFVVAATIFSFAIFSWGTNTTVANVVVGLDLPPFAVMLIISLIYVILGMFIDPMSLMMMTISIVVPIVVNLGYDPIWFGILLVILLEVGMITPPVGMNLFTIHAISPPGTIALGDIARGSFPYVVMILITAVALILFPDLVLLTVRQ